MNTKPQENKICANCNSNFTIETEDFNFYEKIKVPPPTWCPECRMIRKMAWRNVRTLYKIPCRSEGHTENIVSIYSKDKSMNVVDPKFWWSDQWDPIALGVEYDFSRPFFKQFGELLRIAPLPSINNVNPVNTEYANVTIDSKNCYLVFSSSQNENCSYSEGINNCKNSLDLLSCKHSDFIYESIHCRNSFKIAYCNKAIGCADSMFLYDCRNCSDCFGCWNLRNKKYCIFNEQFSQEGYFEKIKSFNLESRNSLDKIKKIYVEKMNNAIRKFANITSSNNTTGDNIESSRNCQNCFDVNNLNNSKYVWNFLEDNASDNYDIVVGTHPELCYECAGAGSAYNSKFCLSIINTSNSQYSHNCVSGNDNLFGCVGLNQKSYCILNKQYTKEEYEKLVPKIIQHMNDMPYIDKKGKVYKYGEFFPVELSPFCYNETIAQEYFPLTKEQALEKNYEWKDDEVRNFEINIPNLDIPDDIRQVDENIINKIIECQHKGECNEQCTEAFKIIQSEFALYKHLNIPLPVFCPNCRHFQRLKQRNPLKLWPRKCMNEGCSNQFETPYAPDRPEKVYCESCYNKEVY